MQAAFPAAPRGTAAHPVLIPLSGGCPGRQDRLSTRYSPVRHFTRNRSPFRVRLACVKHAAGVRSEPGSNSPVYISRPVARFSKENQGPDFFSADRPGQNPLSAPDPLRFGPPQCCSVFKDQNTARRLHVPLPSLPGGFVLQRGASSFILHAAPRVK
jgi:hypothetical protein